MFDTADLMKAITTIQTVKPPFIPADAEVMTAIVEWPAGSAGAPPHRHPGGPAFGYVLEGATLGGQVIGRHAAAHGLDAAGLSFFRSYGADVGPMWRRFCEILEMHCRGAEAQSGAVFGALQAFEHLEAWILQRTAALGTATA